MANPTLYIREVYGDSLDGLPPLDQARRRDGCCLLGLYARDGCVSGFDVHHIETRGSGGPDSLDNLICLCRKHHQDVHEGRYRKEHLRWLLWFYFRYPFTSMERIPRQSMS